MPSTSNFDLTYNQQNVVAGGALSNPAATTGVVGGGVDQILAGTNVSISPTSGVGIVTISATGGGGSTTGQSILAGNNSGGFQNVSLTGLNYDTTSHTLSTTNNGNVVGPSTGATDGNVPLYDGTTGKLIKNGPAPNITIAGTSTALGGSISQDTITGLSAAAGIVKHTSSANTLALATAGTDYSAGTSSLATGIVKSTTTTGALSIAAASDINSTLGTQSANVVYAGPSSGTTPANPAFRSLVNADLPTVAIAHGGTGVTTAPTDGQLLIGNSSTGGYSLATLAGAGTVSITNGHGTITITGTGSGGGGNVVGPSGVAASGDVALYDGTTGLLIKDGPQPNITIAGTSTSLGGSITQDTITGLTSTGIVKRTGANALSIATGSDLNSTFGSQTAKTFYAAPNGSSGTPSFRAIAVSDVPTLNQNTSGTAANVTGTVAVSNGGTGLTGIPTNGQIPIGNGSGYTLNTITGTGTVSVTNGTGTISINGSGISNPMTSVGDLIVGGTSGTPTRLAGNNVGTLYRLTQSGTGSASTAPIWRQDNIFNVKDYGAAGDGTTPDDTPLQNALTAAANANGCLYIPTGNYKYSTGLTLPSGFVGKISIKGDGYRVSTLLYVGTGTALDLELTSGTTGSGGTVYYNNVEIYDIGIIANATSAASTGLKIAYINGTSPSSGQNFDETHPGVVLDGLYISPLFTGLYVQANANAGFNYGIKLFGVCEASLKDVYVVGNDSNYLNTWNSTNGWAAGTRGIWLSGGVNNFWHNVNVRYWAQGIVFSAPPVAVPSGTATWTSGTYYTAGQYVQASYAYNAIYGVVTVYAYCWVSHTAASDFETDFNNGNWIIQKYPVEGNFMSQINGVELGEFIHIYGTTGIGYNPGSNLTEPNTTTINNFQLDNGYGASGTYVGNRRGIVLENTNNTFITNGLGILGSSSGSPVVGVYNSTTTTISNCKLYNGNTTNGNALQFSNYVDYGGATLSGSTNCLVTNCLLVGAGGSGRGAQIDSSCSNITIMGCSTIGSGASGVLDNGSSDIVVYNQT
jgi:Pectate lyase superfamily protein